MAFLQPYAIRSLEGGLSGEIRQVGKAHSKQIGQGQQDKSDSAEQID